ncbi:hypothetical protein IHQ71_20920 [Rhizobium sp. TH2]|uniref:hypothetical protein n=1 Tax=Rhizobium sp. TH2 TaxID=2775403 RepID=UPI0021582F09|nr:hypothetical protein [Rhizobium sp. TH2]UVC07636.1 hypothetical protein IHQ71_20920 [Rhizobium sp. TH2]
MTALVIGIGALGFAAVSQAGMTVRLDTAQKTSRIEATVVTKYVLPGCRIEKTLKYDFHGNPYLKKVRICA